MTTSHLEQPSSPQTRQICIQPQTGGIRVLGTGPGLGIVFLFVFFFFLVSLSNSKEKLNHLEVLIIPPGDSNLIHKSCLAVRKKKDH